MTRDYSNFDNYYTELITDIYAQPSDDKHAGAMRAVITEWLSRLKINSVLDVGCGEGVAQGYFKEINPDINYLGIAIGADVVKAQQAGRNVVVGDFNFIDTCPDCYYDLVFARHALEHSPFPLITLMEWHRVSCKYLCVVLPNPRHYTYTGRNHYSVLHSTQAAWLLRRAGWMVRKFHTDEEEFWFLCEKKPRISYEGWARIPLSTELHQFERDQLIDKGNSSTVVVTGKFK